MDIKTQSLFLPFDLNISLHNTIPKPKYINKFFNILTCTQYLYSKGKGVPQQTKVAQGVPGRLRPRIILTFGTTRVVGRQPYTPAAFTSGEIPGAHFQRLSLPQDTWFLRGKPR